MSALEFVASCGARDPAGVAADASTLRGEAGILEVRLDRFADPATIDLAALRGSIARRAIFTLRPKAEGGEFAGSLAQRLALHRAADAAGFDWLDVESDIAAALPRGRARRIVSWHGFATGSDVATRVAELARLDADLIKVAGHAADPAEALRFVQSAVNAGREHRVPVVAIAMGEAGRWLRPLAGRFGMPLLYTAVHPSRKTADGQITIDDAVDLYRAERVTAATRVFAVTGSDVRRSLSPLVHNATFAAGGIDGVYVDVSADDFTPIAEVARALPFAGLSVTQPFKPDALAFAADADSVARALGAANTLIRRDDGEFRASNTDAPGFRSAIALALEDPDACLALTVGHDRTVPSRLRFDSGSRLPTRRKIEHALVYGTGGAARGVAGALRDAGTKVAVTGRDQNAATALALSLGRIESVSEGRARSLKFDLLVKCVPDLPDDELALNPLDFAPGGFAADAVYRPIDTAFLRAARAAGRVPVPGILMFAAQAALQAAAFTGSRPDDVLPAIAAALERAR